jgi:hypothetical protein
MIEKPTTCELGAGCCAHGGRCAGKTHHAYGCHLDGDEKPHKSARAVRAWCIQLETGRRPYLFTDTLRGTRRAAWEAYDEPVHPEYRARARKHARAVRVLVTPEDE